MPGGESYMKKAIIILMSVLLITSFAACRNGDTPETAGTTVPENTSAESTAKMSPALQTIEKTLDGVTLKVYIENPKVKPGGEVHITATVTNNSGKDIVSTLPIYNRQHYEIRTKILTQDGKAFYDKDYPVEMTEDATRQFIVKSGESYVQDMYLVAAEMNSGMSGTADAMPYGAGKCAGTSTFKWDGGNGAEKSLMVSFEIEIA
jgi:multidrug efflux pump subunit AcrA (membrane-fusion protein)